MYAMETREVNKTSLADNYKLEKKMIDNMFSEKIRGVSSAPLQTREDVACQERTLCVKDLGRLRAC